MVGMSSRENLEWQLAEGSKTAHVLDTETREGKWSGSKALCGRYPQRQYRWWFGLSVDDPGVKSALNETGASRCDDCMRILSEIES